MFKIALKNRIKHNLIGFISLLLLSAIAVSVFAAGMTFPSAIRGRVNRYINETNFWDVHVSSTLGFNSEDISSVTAINGVTKVMSVLSSKSSVSVNNNGNYKAYIAATDFKTLGLSSAGFIGALTLTEGSFPLNSTGCVVVKSGSLNNSIEIGDQIKLTSLNDDLSETVFTVTGIGVSPSMLGDKGNIVLPDADFAIYINDGAFKDKKSYSEMFIRVEGDNNRNAFINKPNKTVTQVKENIAKLATDLEFKRTEELSGAYDKNVDKAQKQYDYIKEDSEKKLSEVSLTVKNTGERIAAEKKKVEAKQSEVDALKKEFEGDTAEIEELRKKEELTDKEKEKIEKYDQKVATFTAAETELNTVKSTFELNNATYESLKNEYEILKKLTEQKLKDAEAKLNDAKNNNQVTDSQIWKISDITDDGGYLSLKKGITSSSLMLCTVSLLVFAVAVVLIILVVSLCAEKHDKDMVVFERHGYLISEVKKADGIIALAGVLIGGVLGIVIGNFVLAESAFTVFCGNYSLPEITVGFPHYSGFAALLIIAAVSILSLYRIPKNEEKENRTLYVETVEKINKYLNVGSKMALRNTFGNPKKAILGITVTAVIVSLITALLSSGIALNGVAEKQQKIQRYNLSASVSIPNYAENEQLLNCLNDKTVINKYTAVTAKKLTLDNGKNISVNVYCLNESEEMRQVLNLKGKNTDTIAPDSVIVGENTAKQNNIKIGDEITLITSSGTATLKVTGICKNYIDNYIYIGNMVYETYFANEGFTPMLLVDAEVTLTAMSGLLTSGAVFEVNRLSGNESLAPALDGTLKTVIIIGIMVLVLLLIAFNIVLILSNREKREKALKTFNLNGKGVLSSHLYVFSDLIVKNVLGTVLGIFIGIIMFILILVAVNSNTIMYSSFAEWNAILFSAVISVVCVPVSVLIKVIWNFVNKKTAV